MKVTLTRITGDPILAIEEAASNCYDSIPSEDGKKQIITILITFYREGDL